MSRWLFIEPRAWGIVCFCLCVVVQTPPCVHFSLGLQTIRCRHVFMYYYLITTMCQRKSQDANKNVFYQFTLCPVCLLSLFSLVQKYCSWISSTTTARLWHRCCWIWSRISRVSSMSPEIFLHTLSLHSSDFSANHLMIGWSMLDKDNWSFGLIPRSDVFKAHRSAVQSLRV